MTGMDLAPGWVDVGTANYPTWTEPAVFSEKAALPVFKITCDRSAPPHPYLGRRIYTTDPGRALITGRCNDVGSIVMGQFRGLAARAPYFSNGSAATLGELVAIADGYFEGIAKHDSRLVSSAVDCNRFENGVRMTNRPGAEPTPRACATAVDRLTHIKAVTERRYPVVDEERGVVLSMVVFDIPADAASTPPREGRMLLLAELFKIASGEIQRIETVMHNLPYGSGSGWAAK